MTPRIRRIGYAALVVVTLAGLWMIYNQVADQANSAASSARSADRKSDANIAALAEANAKVAALGVQVRGLGEKPVVSTSQVFPGATGAIGATGAPGAPGANGRDGVDGAASNGTNGKDGAAGKDGKDGVGTPGTNGTDGRGVASVECTSPLPFQITFHYTDGTTDTQTCGVIEP